MKVKITGSLLNNSGVESCDLECEVLSKTAHSTLREMLVRDGYVVLKTIAGPHRFFLFLGSRITETRSQTEAERLGKLLVEEESLPRESRITSADSPYHRYRMAVEISGGFASDSEENGVATIRSSVG